MFDGLAARGIGGFGGGLTVAMVGAMAVAMALGIHGLRWRPWVSRFTEGVDSMSLSPALS